MRARLKRLVARALRPAVEPTTRAVHERAGALERRLEEIERTLERLAPPAADPDKLREELAYWRWLIRSEAGRSSLHAPFEIAFARWQRDRLRELGRVIGLEDDAALDRWCAGRSVVEIGAGPYPAAAAAPAWGRAVAVDPLARAYVEEGLIPRSAAHITFVDAPGERVPLPAGIADLVIIENALDHVGDPGAVLREARRLLDGETGRLWLLVDLSEHTDRLHPHRFSEAGIRALLIESGFEAVSDRVSDHKSHPKAYGEYRGLLRPMSRPAPVLAEAKPAAGVKSSEIRA